MDHQNQLTLRLLVKILPCSNPESSIDHLDSTFGRWQAVDYNWYILIVVKELLDVVSN